MRSFNHSTAGLFASPLTKIKDIQNYQTVLNIFEEKIKNQTNLDKNSSSGFPIHIQSNGITSYYNHGSILNTFSELKELKEELTDAANFVWQRVLNYDSDLIITQSWLNESDVDAIQSFHNHANSIFCGTLYLNVETSLVFEPQGHSGNHSVLIERPNYQRPNEFGYSYHHQYISIPVSPGEVLFWPSYLRHGYFENEIGGRLSLSFNMMPSRINDLYSFGVESIF